jgi:hypothetical protein
MATECAHVAEHVKNVKPHSHGCEECLKMGDTWVHLRMCLECGHVGLLRLVKEPPRAGAFSFIASSGDPVCRTGRGLAVVLRG